MARIRKLTAESRNGSTAHPTQVDARWQVVRGPGSQRLFQLSTYGSDERVSEPKVSQTVQIDKAMAAELVRLLQTTFDL